MPQAFPEIRPHYEGFGAAAELRNPFAGRH
jgi:hypothetical protein